MRRKRQNRSTWFPILGTDTFNTGAFSSYDTRDLTVHANYAPSVIAVPIIPDFSADPNDSTDTQGYTLRDFVEGSACIIERIVGKIVWGIQQIPPPSEQSTVAVAIACTAFAVLPTQNDDPGTPELPNISEYDPLLAENMDKPYLWRRTWVLANNAAVPIDPGVQAGQFSHPASNEFFASRDDGPHIDTKGTRRRVMRNERIWMIHSVMSLTGGDPEASGESQVVADVRVLGRLTRQRNKGTFV